MNRVSVSVEDLASQPKLRAAAVVLSKRALVDMTTVAIAVTSLVALLGFKKIPEPILILGAGTAGIVLHGVP